VPTFAVGAVQTPETITTFRLLRWQLKSIAVFATLSTVVVIAEQLTGRVAGVLPDVPVTVLGSAIGIYVSFRTNAAYGRWWEGRKLWGQLVNSSRHFCAQAIANLPGDELREPCRALVLHQVLYVHALRCILRGDSVEDDPDVKRVAEESEVKVEPGHPSLTTGLLRQQLRDLSDLEKRGILDARRLQSMDQTLSTLLDVQGGCERIQNTPPPPNYGHITELLIRTYAVMLPLAIVDDLHWIAIPASIVVCLAFKLMSAAGRVIENPFTRSWDALPLHALSRTIERNLREAIGDRKPPPAEADRYGVLL
jgi:putative membrane protein